MDQFCELTGIFEFVFISMGMMSIRSFFYILLSSKQKYLKKKNLKAR